MRKIFFVIISLLIVSKSFGQKHIKNNSGMSDIQFAVPQKNTATAFSKTTINDWYQPNKFVEADSMIGSKLVHFVNFMQHDSLAKIINANGSVDQNSWLSIGRVLDPKDTMISYTANPQQRLSNYTSYTLDSIRFTYAYVRNTDSLTIGSSQKISVVDTLFISYFKGNSIQRYSFETTLNKYALVNWIGDSTRMPANYIKMDTILLTKNDSTGIANIGGGFENFYNLKSFVHKAPTGLNFISIGGKDTDNLIAYTLTFKSGIQTVIGNDTAVMICHKNPTTLPTGTRRTNYFGFYFAENKDLDTLPWNNPTYFNTSLLAPWWCAYTVSNDWYGYVSGNAYANEIFIDADFHLITSPNAAVIELPKDILVKNLYPNPVKIGEPLFINTNIKNLSEVTVDIYDITGKLVVSKKYVNVIGDIFQTTISGISTGMYFVKISANGISHTQKLSIID